MVTHVTILLTTRELRLSTSQAMLWYLEHMPNQQSLRWSIRIVQ